MYKKVKDKNGNLLNVIIRVSDGAWIPMSNSNLDYVNYLEWLNEGNTPLEAD